MWENSRPVQLEGTQPTSSSPTARLDRAKAHTRALSNSFRSATTTAMNSVGPKTAGYSALANGSSSTMQQPLRLDSEETSHEMRELLSHGAGSNEAISFTGNKSVETATAGCEQDEDDGSRIFSRTN